MQVFFDFSSKFALNDFHASPINFNLDNKTKLITGDYIGIDFPVTFKQYEGKKLTDVLDTGFAGLYLISEKFKTILEENTLTGWKVYSIKLFDKKGIEVFGYHGFSVTGRCAAVDYGKSEIIEKRLVSHGPICKYYKGMFIDDWDGTDFFTPERTLYTLITKKAANALKKNKITNFRLENLTDIETDVKIIKYY